MPVNIPAIVPLPTLKAHEVALLEGEQEEPTWKSPNELIHERVNFDDTIWGFGLAGGAHYQTPLRVTYVRPGSRAQKANIFPGDVVLKINGIDSRELTLKQAHKMIVDSGIHLVINVTAPEDDKEAYYVYVDPLEAEVPEEEVAKKEKPKPPKVPRPYSKCSHWALQWPWRCRKKPIYKESNCYMVPSKFVEKYGHKLKPEVKPDDTIVLDSIYNVKGKTEGTGAEGKSNNTVNDKLEHGNEVTESTGAVDNKDGIANGGDNENNNVNDNLEHGNEATEATAVGNKEGIANNDGNENNTINDNLEHGTEETEPTDIVDNKDGIANSGDIENNTVNDNAEHSNEETELTGPVDNKDGVANDGDNENITVNTVNDNTGHGNEETKSTSVVDNKEEVANGGDNENNTVNDNAEHGNEVTESSDTVNNKDGVANGGDNENNPNFDKLVNGGISVGGDEVSESENVITNGR